MPNELADWLEGLGIGKYLDAFAENDVEFHTLPELTEEDLNQLGLSLGHRRAFQKAVRRLSNIGHQISKSPPSTPTNIGN